MRIGLIDVDSHNYPNLALMKLSAHHKLKGDDVKWWNGFEQYDLVYMAKIFDDSLTPDIAEPFNTKRIIKGGTGYDLRNTLPNEIEHIMPDYDLYKGITNKYRPDTAYGFLTRGCPRNCPFCIVGEKEGLKSYKVADLSEWWNGQKEIKLYDPNLLAYKGCLELIDQLAKSKALVDLNQGIDARFLTEERILALNEVKIKVIHMAWDLMKEEKQVIKGLELYAKYGKVGSHNRIVYVLCNFDTAIEQDLYRIYTIRDLGFTPYVMKGV